MIRIRVAETADQPRLIEFIRDHWSSTHIFTHVPDVFSWQHGSADGRINVVLAEEITEDQRTVLGVQGFIPTGRYDDALGDQEMALAIWKVRDGAPPGVGVQLLRFIEREFRPRLIVAIAISEMVKPIYAMLRYELASLDHSAIFNPDRHRRLRVADNVPDEAFAPAATGGGDTVSLSSLDLNVSDEVRHVVDRLAASARPVKSWTYVAERYLRHPWYEYSVWLVRHDARPTAVVVWRNVEAENTRVLRIVDIVGQTQWLADAHRVLQDHVVRAGAEYIDLMQWGIDGDVVDAGGFVGTRSHPGIVIPNYFSPFERRNVEIDLTFKISVDDDLPFHLYRADSDQDRPNTVADLARPQHL